MVGCAADVPIIAHRGASYDAPENTLAAFELAWERGADGIEGDFHVTADGAIVCIHDADTKRTGDSEHVVARSTLAELRAVDVGAWKGARFAGETMPTLDEVLSTVPADGVVYIEIKCGGEILPALAGTIDRSPLRDEQMIIISFNESVVRLSKLAFPEIKAFWLTGYDVDEATGNISPTREEILATLRATGADGVGSNAHASIDASFVRAIRDAGFEFHVWTIDDPAVADLFISYGAQSITTNRPAWIDERMTAQ
jgi:glycerophosphoryl diester phosphodiesterase